MRRTTESPPRWWVAGSHERVWWWKCPNGPDHGQRQATIRDRTQDCNGCPCCAGKKLSVTNSLATVAPEVAAQWHPTKNERLTPEEVVAGSERIVWWKCPKGPEHEWPAKVEHRTRLSSGCPLCTAPGWTLQAIRAFVKIPREPSQHPVHGRRTLLALPAEWPARQPRPRQGLREGQLRNRPISSLKRSTNSRMASLHSPIS